MRPGEARAANEGMRELSVPLANMIGRIGRDGFDASLGELLVSAAQFDQCIVFSFGKDDAAARCLYTWHRYKPEATAHLAQCYVDGGFFNQDPLLARLRQGRHDGGESIGFIRREHIANAWYRNFFFDGVELSGKMSLMERSEAGGAYLNFYTGADTEFSDREVDNLAGLSTVVCRCITRHQELAAKSATGGGSRVEVLSRLLARKAPRLTAREREVCARIVAGYSSEAMALDLGIAESSVATYRKRAYAKLGICSQHELFSLCLAAAEDDA